MPLPLILSAVCGQEPTTFVDAHGDYLDWFQEALQGRVELVPWIVQEHDQPPPLTEYAGVLVTGSPASMTKPQPWMEVVVALIREASETKVPLLGVCFGHQLVGCAYGSPTVAAPDQGELGTHSIQLSKAGQEDLLFRGCPTSFPVQLSHQDQVAPDSIRYSNGLQVLASSANTQVQALAGGDYIRSVQFHPEFSRSTMCAYLAVKEADTSQALDCPFGRQVLHNWLDGWIFNS